MNQQLKIKPSSPLQKIAAAHIEKRAVEDDLRAAQFALDVQLHDLRTEFLNREGKLRDEYLERVATVAGEAMA